MTKKRKDDPIRENRIDNQAIVDAYGPEERAMGWYYYLENQLRFPFEARCAFSKVVSPLSKGETVQVLRMAPEEACSADMLVLARLQSLRRLDFLMFELETYLADIPGAAPAAEAAGAGTVLAPGRV